MIGCSPPVISHVSARELVAAVAQKVVVYYSDVFSVAFVDYADSLHVIADCVMADILRWRIHLGRS